MDCTHHWLKVHMIFEKIIYYNESIIFMNKSSDIAKGYVACSLNEKSK